MKTKKIILIISVLTVFIFAGVPALGQNKILADTAATQDNVIYTCTMHPEIQSSKPGACPKCGMALVKKLDVSVEQPQKHKMKMMCPMMTSMNDMGSGKSGENMEDNNSTENNKMTNDATQSTKPAKKEKKHKMSSMGMGMGIGMGIMMAGMLVFLIGR